MTGRIWDAVWDIETEAWDRFVVGGILHSDGRYESHREPRAMLDALLSIEGDVWAHNAGHFDTLWALDELSRRTPIPPVRLDSAGGRITRATIGRTVLRDSYALVPMSLAAAAPLGGRGVAKEGTGLPCRCGAGCGGYCAIRRGMSARAYRAVESYLESDCRVLAAVLDGVAGLAAEHGLSLRGTIGGTAWRSAAAYAGMEAARWTRGEYVLARSGYYGGRTQVFRPRAAHGHWYDIHSAYPAALVQADVPVGVPRTVAGREARDAYARGDAGIWQADVRVSRDDMIPPLPVRTGERLAYPVGQFDGRWTGIELRAAEHCGATVEPRYGLVWRETARPFAAWCRRIWDLRHAAASGGRAAEAKWWKLLANSLTGKLAQHPESELLVMRADAPALCAGAAPCTPRRCSGACGGWLPVGSGGRLWSRATWRVADCAHVAIAAHLTAVTRSRLLSRLRAAGADAVYCDTDSAPSLRAMAHDDELGGWGYEGEFKNWEALAPKTYRYTRARDDAAVVRAKGVPRADLGAFEALAAGGEVVVDTGVEGLRRAAALGGPLFRRRLLRRRWLGDGVHFGDRRLPAGADFTVPPDFPADRKDVDDDA